MQCPLLCTERGLPPWQWAERMACKSLALSPYSLACSGILTHPAACFLVYHLLRCWLSQAPLFCPPPPPVITLHY